MKEYKYIRLTKVGGYGTRHNIYVGAECVGATYLGFLELKYAVNINELEEILDFMRSLNGKA